MTDTINKVNVGLDITHSQCGEVLMEFFGGERISKDIGYFLAVRFGLVRNIVEYYISKKVDVDTFRNDMELLSNFVEFSNFMNDYPLVPLSISKLMSILSKANYSIYMGLLEKWAETPSSELLEYVVDIERLKEMLMANDKQMLRHLSQSSIMNINPLFFVLDFHFKCEYIDYALSKKIKLCVYEVMKAQNDPLFLNRLLCMKFSNQF